MTTADEAAAANSELAADLAAGVQTISLDQEITFTKYVKVVLPLDGFVFWVRAEILSASALLNAARFNQVRPNEPATPVTAANMIVAKGSLHVATQQAQTVDATMAINSVVFTSLADIQDFNAIGPLVIYIAEHDGIRFAFNARRSFYKQAALYHYVGNAIYSTMATQIVDAPADLQNAGLVVSNSLPLWLGLNGYRPAPQAVENVVTLYPSFAVPDNLLPPYGAVHVRPEATTALSTAPTLGRTQTHDQLCKDTVDVTLYGLRNNAALAFMDAVNQYSLDTDRIGIMNLPALRDEKVVQSELSILAMKKTATFEVSYYQSAARSVARQLILSCVPSFDIADPQPAN